MQAHSAPDVQVIEPPPRWPLPDLRELARFRELIVFLGRRDISVRYRQTVIGAVWAILQPVAFAAVFSLVLTLWERPPSGGIPFPVFALTGMTLWLFISSSLAQVATSTVNSAALISKVYFPRLVIPVAAIIAPAVDFLVALAVLAVAMALYGVAPPAQIVLLPAVFLLSALTTLGAGLWLSALAVRFRDIPVAIPFVLQISLFAAPVLYQLSLVPEKWRTLYSLNPLVGVLEAFRWTVLGTEWPGAILLIPLATMVVLLVGGLLYFARAETRFADDV